MHHIKLIQGGNDKNNLVFMASDGFAKEAAIVGGDWNVTLDHGKTTSIVAKAATQTKMPILGVTFTWASSDAEKVTVDDGMIEAVGTGTAEITATAVGRGIAVTFDVMVLSEVKSIVITSPSDGDLISNGESIPLVATARDAAQDDKMAGIEGTEVDVDITFESSDPSVISIDGSTATAKSVGEADITAKYEGVSSKAITINVTPGGEVTHIITFTRILTAARSIHIIYNADSTAAALFTGNEDRMDGSGSTTDPADVVYTVAVNEYDSEGNYATDTGATVASLTFRLQQSSEVLDDTGITVSLIGGEGTVTVATSADGGLTSKALTGSFSNAVVGAGTSRIILSYPGADDRVLPAIMVTEAVEPAADGG